MGCRSLRVLLLAALTLACGCAAARELAALHQVEFRFDRISSPRVAGVPLERIRSYGDLSAAEIARLGMAVAAADIPMELTVHVEGRNPETNTVTARLVAMDWSYLVDDREVVAGRLTDPVSFAPGAAQDVPLRVGFNMVSVFDERGRDLVEVALALAGQGTSAHRVAFRIAPTVDTPLGPIRYAVPITFDLSANQGQ